MASPALVFIQNLGIQKSAPHEDKNPSSKGKLVGGSVLSFTDKLNTQDKEDLSNALLLAQLGADHHIKGGGDPITMGRKWYDFYMLVLENLGFIKKLDIPFTEYKTSTASIAMDAVALDALQQVISSEDELLALKTTLECLRKIADEKGNPMFPVFEGQCKKEDIYSFQIYQCDTSQSGDVVVTLGAFYMHSKQKVERNFFFFNYKKHETKVFKATQQCVFNRRHYAQVREEVIRKLGKDCDKFIHDL